VEDLVCINEIILTELAPALMKKGEKDVSEGLQAIEMIPIKPS
jgi:hypothetical protein